MKNEQEEKLRSELIESMLEYLEGKTSARAVLTLGINSIHKGFVYKNKNLTDVILELNRIANEIGNGKVYSRITLNDIFTGMLEKLTRK